MTNAILCLSLLLVPAFIRLCTIQPESSQGGGNELEVSLDLRPFESPISTYLHLSGEGKARLVRYNRSLLVVVAVLDGNLREAELSRLRSLASDPVFKATLLNGDFSGAGLSRGNQFYLTFRSQGDAGGRISGFIDDAPVEVRRFVEEAQLLARHLIDVSSPNGFLRGIPIGKGRLDEIRREGKLPLRSIRTLSADLQQIVNYVIHAPQAFHQLTKSQYDQLLNLASPGHELFVLSDDSGHQLTLYRSAK